MVTGVVLAVFASDHFFNGGFIVKGRLFTCVATVFLSQNEVKTDDFQGGRSCHGGCVQENTVEFVGASTLRRSPLVSAANDGAEGYLGNHQGVGKAAALMR